MALLAVEIWCCRIGLVKRSSSLAFATNLSHSRPSSNLRGSLPNLAGRTDLECQAYVVAADKHPESLVDAAVAWEAS